jgi:hypothetical protein
VEIGNDGTSFKHNSHWHIDDAKTTSDSQCSCTCLVSLVSVTRNRSNPVCCQAVFNSCQNFHSGIVVKSFPMDMNNGIPLKRNLHGQIVDITVTNSNCCCTYLVSLVSITANRSRQLSLVFYAGGNKFGQTSSLANLKPCPKRLFWDINMC